MEMICIHIEGTHLTRHHELVAGLNRPHEWSPIRDRNRMAWYECNCGCEDCKGFLALRVSNVGLGKTVSCGSMGRKMFIGHMDMRAANLPKATRKAMFNLMHGNVKSRRLAAWAVARKYRVTPYLVTFAVRAHKRAIKALAALYAGAVDLLSKTERSWIEWCAWEDNDPNRKAQKQRATFLATLTWKERMSIHNSERLSQEATAKEFADWLPEKLSAWMNSPDRVWEFA